MAGTPCWPLPQGVCGRP